jgi:hypothetical protein
MSAMPSGMVFGNFGQYYLALNGRLVLLFQSDPEAFRAIVMHELSHLRNGDVNKTCLTVSLWKAFVFTALLPMVLYLLQGAFLDGWMLLNALLHSYPLPPLSHVWLDSLLPLIILSLAIYMVRNAVIQARENYADARALTWVSLDGMEHVINDLSNKYTLLSQLRDYHPNPRERLHLLRVPKDLFRMRFWEAFGAGLIFMIALPNIFMLLAMPHFIKFEATESSILYLDFPFTTLLLGPCIAGILSLGIWRATLAHLRYGTRTTYQSATQLGFHAGYIIRADTLLPRYFLSPLSAGCFPPDEFRYSLGTTDFRYPALSEPMGCRQYFGMVGSCSKLAFASSGLLDQSAPHGSSVRSVVLDPLLTACRHPANIESCCRCSKRKYN